jgi:hypothetical protein
MADKREKLFGADLKVAGLRLEYAAEGAQADKRISLTHLDIEDFSGEVAGLSYGARALSIDCVETTLGHGPVRAQAADLADFRLRGEHVELSARRVSCPSGLVYTGHRELYAPHLSFEDVRLVIDDPIALLQRDRAQAPEREPMDLHFLDVLQGRLDIDLAVDMTLPWVGRRRVTHYFRIPIDSGTIDYEKLENDVHWLEATFLTLDVVGDRLVLARDVPLLPYSGKALLWWPLEPEDAPLAAYRRVHLRNLLRWHVPERKKAAADKSDKNKPAKSKLALHALAMENVKLALHASAPAQLCLADGASLQFGDDHSPGLANLMLTGELRYLADADDAPRTALRGSADLLDVTLSDVSLGRGSISVDRLHIGGIEHFEASFHGFRPQRLELVIGRMAATNVRVHLH